MERTNPPMHANDTQPGNDRFHESKAKYNQRLGDVCEKRQEAFDASAQPTDDDTWIVAEALPALVAMANQFQERAAKHVAYVDLLSSVDGLLLGIEAFAGELLDAAEPTLLAGLRQFESSNHLGWVALARCATLDVISKHPAVVAAAAEGAHTALWNALQRRDFE